MDTFKSSAIDTFKLKALRDLSLPTTAMQVWFCASVLLTGIAAGNMFAEPVSRFSDDIEFHFGAMFGGFLGAAIANIPVWIIFDMFRRVVLNQQEIYFASARQNHPPQN